MPTPPRMVSAGDQASSGAPSWWMEAYAAERMRFVQTTPTLPGPNAAMEAMSVGSMVASGRANALGAVQIVSASVVWLSQTLPSTVKATHMTSLESLVSTAGVPPVG